MNDGIRQRNAWLHGWAGLLLGWLMFMIFVTGTISFFRQEVTFWMQPELHRAKPAPDPAERGLAKLAAIAPDARSWTVNLPSERNNSLRVSWNTGESARGADRGERGAGRREERAERGQRAGKERGGGPRAETPRSGDGHPSEARRGGRGGTDRAASAAIVSAERAQAEAAAKAANARGGRPRAPSLTLDPDTGAVLAPRETAGGEFLYHLHYQLHAIPRDWGRWIVGIATFAMLVALISGVVTHKKIFRDFFTFRRNKGQRSWLDAHNAVAVLSLPFHLMITYSGLLLLGGTLLPWGAQALFGEDARGAGQRAERVEERRMEALRDGIARTGHTSALPIGDLVTRAERHWGQPVGRITIERPGKPGSTVQLTPQRNDSLLLRAGGGPGRSLTLDAATGAVIDETSHVAANAIEGTDRVFSSLHLARFASWGLRWMYFLSGVLGTIMVGTGLILWSVKRAEKLRGRPIPFGQRLVEHLNIGAVAGLMVAIPAYFWINRLLPGSMAGRVDKEIMGFFLIWGLTFLYPFVRPAARAWRELIAAGGVLFMALPLLNDITGGMGLWNAIPTGNWLVAGFDLVSLLTGGAMLATAHHLGRKGPRALRTSRSVPFAQPAE